MRRFLLIAVVAVVLSVSSSAPADPATIEGADPTTQASEDARAWALTNTVGGDDITEGGLLTKHWKFFARMLGECGARGLEACVGSKALAFVDGYLSQKSIPLTEGVALIRRNATEEERASEGGQQVEASGDNSSVLQQLFDRFSRFLRTYAVQLRFPETNQEEVAIGLDEGRKLKKFLLPIILGIGVKVLGVIPLVFGGLALLVGKAVFVSKLAFVVAALVGLSSIMSGFRGSGGGDTAAQRVRLPLLSQVFAPAQPAVAYAQPQATQYSAASPGGVSWPAAASSASTYGTSGGSSGWSRRSADEAQDAQEMAYAKQIPHDYYE